MNIDEILEERGARYGSDRETGYRELALIAQNIKSAMRHSPNWNKLPADMRESLEMLASKLARILNGDFNYADSWMDSIGYLKLVLERMEAQDEKQEG